MAEVFKAKTFGPPGATASGAFEKILAIKRILPSLAEDADFITMFIDEARICGQLHHPNICQIFELGRVQDSHFIAMEFVWGKDLLQIQNRFRKIRQTMSPEMAAFVAMKLCDGLDHAHKKKDASGKSLGIIHRDVSPQNILVSYDGEVKVIDFGIAKAASRSSKTQAGVLKGKFGYMSPEQVRGLPIDRRSDIFAIGTILYELLTADRLFIGDSDFETLEKVRNVDVPPPSKVVKACPPALERIILKALQKESEDRYQWAGDMQAELAAFLQSHAPSFGTAQIAQWMREQFAAEMRREQEVLEQQRRIGRDAMTSPAAATAAAATAADGGREGAGVGVSLVHQPMGADLPSGSTRVLDEGDLEVIDESELSAEKTTVTPPPGVELPSQSTTILNPAAAPLAPVAGMVNGAAAEPAPLRAESTVILDSATATAGTASAAAAMNLPPSAPGPVRLGPEQRTVLEGYAAPVLPAGSYPTGSTPSQPTPLPPLGSGTDRVSAPPVHGAHGGVVPARSSARGSGGSTLVKDIGIGVAVAAGLLGAVLGVRALVSGGASKKGTLVITANPPRAADVVVDGARRAHMDEGMPLTLKDLVAGPHTVVVRGADGSEFKQTIHVPAGDVAVLPAVLRAPKPATAEAVGTGTLRLKLPPDVTGAQIFVDGAELADGAWRQPIPLRADVPHDVRVRAPQREEAALTVTLKSGEELTESVALARATGAAAAATVAAAPSAPSGDAKLRVTSDPPGAEVGVNGKRVGVTPVDVNDVDLSKSTRVTVRMRGYRDVIKYLQSPNGEPQVLDAKLVAVAETSGGGDPAAEIIPPPKGRPGEASAAPAPIRLVGGEAPAGGEEKATSNEPGYLIANTQPWARVWIDGKDTGKMTPIAPRSKVPLKPGKHVVTFVADGKKFNFDVVVKPGEDVKLTKQLTDAP
jgi:hypothetical protein